MEPSFCYRGLLEARSLERHSTMLRPFASSTSPSGGVLEKPSATSSFGRLLSTRNLWRQFIRLHEDRLGVSESSQDFGLPADEDDAWDDRSWSWWNGWYHDDWTGEDENGADHALPTDPPDEDGDGSAPQGPSGEAEVPPVGATGSSPSHRPDGGSVLGPPLAAIPEHTTPDAQKTPLDELSVADSFIMEVLRGWRLLQAAGLRPKRNVTFCPPLRTRWTMRP